MTDDGLNVPLPRDSPLTHPLTPDLGTPNRTVTCIFRVNKGQARRLLTVTLSEALEEAVQTIPSSLLPLED